MTEEVEYITDNEEIMTEEIESVKDENTVNLSDNKQEIYSILIIKPYVVTLFGILAVLGIVTPVYKF